MSVENMLNQQLNLDWAKNKDVAISANKLCLEEINKVSYLS